MYLESRSKTTAEPRLEPKVLTPWPDLLPPVSHILCKSEPAQGELRCPTGLRVLQLKPSTGKAHQQGQCIEVPKDPPHRSTLEPNRLEPQSRLGQATPWRNQDTWTGCTGMPGGKPGQALPAGG